MPISAEKQRLHPDGSLQLREWRAIRASILERAGNRWEGSLGFPECRTKNHAPYPDTGSRGVLSIAHTDQNPRNNADENLRALCQRCHNKHDAPRRAASTHLTWQRKLKV